MVMQWFDLLLGHYDQPSGIGQVSRAAPTRGRAERRYGRRLATEGGSAMKGQRRTAEQAWSGREAMRVLIEEPDGAMAWASELTLAARGYEVATCPGPEQIRGGCPLLRGVPCTLAAEADAIVVSVPLRGRFGGALLAAHRSARPAGSLCVQVAAPDEQRFADLLEGCQILPLTADAAGLVTRVEHALR